MNWRHQLNNLELAIVIELEAVLHYDQMLDDEGPMYWDVESEHHSGKIKLLIHLANCASENVSRMRQHFGISEERYQRLACQLTEERLERVIEQGRKASAHRLQLKAQEAKY